MNKLKFLLTAAFAILSIHFSANAQSSATAATAQDVIMIGGNIGNIKANFQKDANQFSLQVTPRLGWMLRDRYMWGLYGDIDFSTIENASTQVKYGTGLFLRAYTGHRALENTPNTRFFAEVSSGISGLNAKTHGTSESPSVSSSVNGLAMGFGAGVAYFPVPSVGFELMPRLAINTGAGNAQVRSSLGISLGANVYLQKGSAKRVAKELK